MHVYVEMLQLVIKASPTFLAEPSQMSCRAFSICQMSHSTMRRHNSPKPDLYLLIRDMRQVETTESVKRTQTPCWKASA